MELALQEKLLQLKLRVQAGPVGQFFSWWGSELRQALPEPWQEKLHQASRRLAIEPIDDRIYLSIDDGNRLGRLGELPASADRELLKQQVDDLASGSGMEEAARVMLVDASRCLVKEVSLPVAAESNLRQVLTFEMDRQTPFRAADVYFDWIVMERGSAGGQLRLMLYVVPRAEIDGMVELVHARGFELAGIDVRAGEKTLGLNLMPPEQRYRAVNRKSRDNYILAAAVVLLLIVTMIISLSLRSHQVAELEDAIADVRDEANQVARVRSRIDGAAEAASFLAERRTSSPLVVELLADITKILPDDTYLDRLVINTSSVQLQGKSGNAQQLIEMVNESALLEAASFRGSTRLDARSGLEIFEISAQISAPGGGHGAGR